MIRKCCLFAALLTFVGCSGESSSPTSGVPSTAEELARRAGFSPIGARLHGRHLLVESDILVLADTGEASIPSDVSLLTVSNAQADTGLYTLDISRLPSWAGIATMASRSWTFSTSTGIRIAVSTNGPVAGSIGTISVMPYTSATNPFCPGAFMCAQFRSGSRLGTIIAVNTDLFASAPYTSFDWRASILAHEIGHNLGFRHSNWEGREAATFSSSLGNVTSNAFVVGSFRNNPQSVMLNFFNAPRYPDFWDRTAARLVYPGEAGTLYPRASICPVGCSGGSADDYSVETEDMVPDAIEDQYTFVVDVERPGVAAQRYHAPALGMPAAISSVGSFVLGLTSLGFPTTFLFSCDPGQFPNGVVKLYRVARFPLFGGGRYERLSAPACFRID